MSHVPFDPSSAGGPGASPDEPSEEEIRAYVAQLRAAPVDQVVAEVVQALLNAAQMKLGRRDGRLVLDLVAALADTGRDRLNPDLLRQVDEALTQLRLAQVQAESQVAAAAAQGHQEPNDLGADAPATPPPADGGAQEQGAATPPPAASPPPSAPPSGKRLWVPGR